MFYWYFKLFNNIKSERESYDLARLELESLFGKVEPIYNFIDKIKEYPLSKFISSTIRLQDFLTHELPYGRIQGYFGISDKIKNVNKLVKRLAYTREIYLVTELVEPLENLINLVFPEGELGKNYHYFKVNNLICFRFITHQYFLEKSEYISKLSRNEEEIKNNIKILFSYLIDNIYRIPAPSTLSIGKRLEDYFAIREEPSLYLTHYFYPYKGKFHPKMVRSLLNYIYPNDKGTCLDNFAGSGTLLVEATLMELNSIGVEINPLCVLMSNVKCNSFKFDIEILKKEIENYLEMLKKSLSEYNNFQIKTFSLFREIKFDYKNILEKTKIISKKLKNFLKDKEKLIVQVLIAKEIINKIEDENIKNFLLLTLSGTISDIIRRTNREFIEAFNERVNNLYLRIFLFKKLNEILKINLGNSKSYLSDTRDMEAIISSNSIDGIVTSPPYSIALNYIKNDLPQLILLELTNSIEELESKMIGNPRLNLKQKDLFLKTEEEFEFLTLSKTGEEIIKYLFSYNRKQEALHIFKFYKDMYFSLKEMHRVLKEGSKTVIVIGNNHFIVNGKTVEIPNVQVILELSEKVKFSLDKLIEREVQKSSEGNIRDEAILILKKE